MEINVSDNFMKQTLPAYTHGIHVSLSTSLKMVPALMSGPGPPSGDLLSLSSNMMLSSESSSANLVYVCVCVCVFVCFCVCARECVKAYCIVSA